MRSLYMRLFQAFSSLVHFKRKIKQYSRSKVTQSYALPWPMVYFCELHASVPMCGEEKGVKYELFTRSPYMRLFPAFSFLVHLKRKNKHYYRVKWLKVMHYPGPSPTSVSSTRLFACGERTKVSNSSYSRDPHTCASFLLLAPSCTWKVRSIDISGVKSLKIKH
jgi:hypothetical protein